MAVDAITFSIVVGGFIPNYYIFLNVDILHIISLNITLNSIPALSWITTSFSDLIAPPHSHANRQWKGLQAQDL
jgi:hypothetical protein